MNLFYYEMSPKLILVSNSKVLSFNGVCQNNMSRGIATTIITKKDKMQINSIPKLYFTFEPNCVVVVFIVFVFVVI